MTVLAHQGHPVTGRVGFVPKAYVAYNFFDAYNFFREHGLPGGS